MIKIRKFLINLLAGNDIAVRLNAKGDVSFTDVKGFVFNGWQS